MAEAVGSQVDFAQAVEEQEARLHDRVLEFPRRELARRQPADLEKAPALRAPLESGGALFGWRWRRLCLR
jgi:hypothetical protein